MPRYTFQVLPYHPPIETDESLSSYINRLIVGNRMNKTDFQQFLGKREVFRYIAGIDYGPVWLEPLSEITNVPVEKLEEGTFREFMFNFDRVTRQQVVNQFLVNMISPYQRFCSQCLAEMPIYKLLWRFTAIRYCDKHDCELCDTCPNCHKAIPFISEAPNGICPDCKHILKNSPVQKLIPDEHKEAHLRNWRSLRYLFNPDYKIHVYLRQMMVGRTLRAIRKFHAVSIEEMAGILGTLPRVIERGIEGPRIGNGETFEMYHKHAEHFGFGIGDIFRMVDTHLLSDDTTISQRFVEEDTWGYKEMENVFSLASRLSRNGREWSLAEFQEELGESYNELIKFPLALGIVDSYVRNDMAMDFVVKARSR